MKNIRGLAGSEVGRNVRINDLFLLRHTRTKGSSGMIVSRNIPLHQIQKYKNQSFTHDG